MSQRKFPYIPIVVDDEDATSIVRELTGDAASLSGRIAQLIGEQDLNPLQQQAVLVRAWMQLLRKDPSYWKSRKEKPAPCNGTEREQVEEDGQS